MKKVLIIVDAQKGFINEYTNEIPKRIKDLLDEKLFEEVIFIRFVNSTTRFADFVGWNRLKESPETDFPEELQPYASRIFEKNFFSCFTPEFEDYLKTKNLNQLFFVGIDTNMCVLKSAMDAFDKGYFPHVLAYYCASHSGVEFHEFALKNLEKAIGKKQVILGEVDNL